ncbi:MAG: hypothetical protein C0498_10070 [Anaerolinea sp.]|nr:hypothetical protein [Anaerolinea sp.]
MILLVDDDQTSLFLLMTVLRRDGHATVAFDDPAAALDHIRTQGGITLMITDLRMPTMGGLEFLAAVRQIPGAHYIPVLFCSSAGDAETVRAAISQGVRDYIVKPIDPAIVLRKVRSLLTDTSQIVAGRQTMIVRLGITEAEHRELVARTVPSVERLITGLEAAIDAEDARAIVALAERIEEPASIFAATRCLAAIVAILSAPDAPSQIETGRLLVRETLLFRAAIERSVAQPPVRRQSTWEPTRA